MRKITFSADETLIERARAIAECQSTTLNAAFRQWLEQFTLTSGNLEGYEPLMSRLKYVNSGKRFSRDEMNER